MSVLDELRALEAQATPAPWVSTPDYDVPLRHGKTALIVGGWDGECEFKNDADCEFIAAARNVLPALLDMADAALHATPFLDPLNDDAWSVRNRIIAAFARLERRAS